MMKRSDGCRIRGIWCLAMLACAWALPLATQAAEIQSVSWSDKTPGVLEIHVNGKAAYDTRSLENGERLRLRFAGTSLGSTVTDLAGKGVVKGVYPYLGENATAAFVDVLTTVPGALKVEKAAYGYRVQIAAASRTAGPASVSASPASASPVLAATAANTLEGITYTTLPGNRVEVHLHMAGPAINPVAFTVKTPPRLALDFADTRLQLPTSTTKVDVGAVNSIIAVQGGHRARLVFNLVQSTHYTTQVSGNDVVVSIDPPSTKIRSAEPPKMTQFAVATTSAKHALTDVNFRRGSAGDGKVVVKLSDPGVGINIYQQSGQIIVDFLNTRVPHAMLRRLDVTDFATPVQTIDTYQQGRNVRMVITPQGQYEQLAYQAGNEFTVNVKPVSKEKSAKKTTEAQKYTGEKLSLNFQNIDVRAALQVIADFTGLNFVTSDTVKGNLTLRLKDVPWDQALQIILNAKGLGMRREGDVVLVAPAAELAANEKMELEATKQKQELEPLVSELIQINYAKADQIAALLKSIKAVSGTLPSDQGPFSNVSISKVETESNSLLSPRGQVTVDERTNSILIQDTPSKVREVRKLIAKLDQPVRQVMIEARLVEASDSFSRNLGVKFGTSNVQTSGNWQLSQGASIDPATGTLASGGLNVNLPAASDSNNPAATLGLTLAKLGTSSLINLELSALEAEGKGKIISSPRIITANQQKAHIEQGQQQTINLGFGKSQTLKAVLSLDVTPQITPDHRVILDVNITKDDFVDANSSRLNTKRVQTQVLLDNGETVVIGGIYERNYLNTNTQVPLLGDLPLVGWLFKNKATRDDRSELLIFLTPRILSPSLALN